MPRDVSDTSDENRSGLEIGEGETPPQGGAIVPKAEENDPIPNAEAEQVAELPDITADLTEQIRAAAVEETKARAIDQKRREIYNGLDADEDEDEPYEESHTFGQVAAAVFVLGLIGGGLYLVLSKRGDANEARISQQIKEGVHSEISVDSNGMVS